jgi:hypothetical protein
MSSDTKDPRDVRLGKVTVGPMPDGLADASIGHRQMAHLDPRRLEAFFTPVLRSTAPELRELLKACRHAVESSGVDLTKPPSDDLDAYGAILVQWARADYPGLEPVTTTAEKVLEVLRDLDADDRLDDLFGDLDDSGDWPGEASPFERAVVEWSKAGYPGAPGAS